MTVFSLIDRWLFSTYRASGYLAAILLLTLTVSMLVSIIARLSGYYIGGITEFAGYTMAASAFFGMSYTYANSGHIRVKLAFTVMSPGIRRAVEVGCRGVMAFATVYLAYYLYRLTYFSWDFRERSEGADGLLLWIPQGITTVGAAVFALAGVHLFLRSLADPAAMVAYDDEDNAL